MIWYALSDIICFTEDDGGGRLTESVEGDSKMQREKRFSESGEGDSQKVGRGLYRKWGERFPESGDSQSEGRGIHRKWGGRFT